MTILHGLHVIKAIGPSMAKHQASLFFIGWCMTTDVKQRHECVVAVSRSQSMKSMKSKSIKCRPTILFQRIKWTVGKWPGLAKRMSGSQKEVWLVLLVLFGSEFNNQLHSRVILSPVKLFDCPSQFTGSGCLVTVQKGGRVTQGNQPIWFHAL